MPYVLLQYQVKNINQLRTIFESDSSRRRSKGCKSARLFRDPDDETVCVGLLEFENVEKAREFADSDELRELLGCTGDYSAVRPRVIDEYISMNG